MLLPLLYTHTQVTLCWAAYVAYAASQALAPPAPLDNTQAHAAAVEWQERGRGAESRKGGGSGALASMDAVAIEAAEEVGEVVVEGVAGVAGVGAGARGAEARATYTCKARASKAP